MCGASPRPAPSRGSYRAGGHVHTPSQVAPPVPQGSSTYLPRVARTPRDPRRNERARGRVEGGFAKAGCSHPQKASMQASVEAGGT